MKGLWYVWPGGNSKYHIYHHKRISSPYGGGTRMRWGLVCDTEVPMRPGAMSWKGDHLPKRAIVCMKCQLKYNEMVLAGQFN